MSETTATKSGVKTSEFWTTVIGTASVAAPAICAAISGWGAAASVLGVAASVLPAVYIWGRSILKAEQIRTTNFIPDAWEPLLGRMLDLTEVIANSAPAADDKAGNGQDAG